MISTFRKKSHALLLYFFVGNVFVQYSIIGGLTSLFVPFCPVPFGLSPDKGHKKGRKKDEKGQIFVKKM